MDDGIFVWTARIQNGVVLFGLSLFYLAFVVPGEVGLSTLVGGGAALALYGVTGSRLSFGVLAMLMIVVVGCAFFAAVTAGRLPLIPVAVAQMIAAFLMHRPERRFRISPAMLSARRI